MNRFVGIGEAAKVRGVSVSTLRRWEAQGHITPEHTTGHRRYDLAKLRPELFHAAAAARLTVAYARVSSHDQREDLEIVRFAERHLCGGARSHLACQTL